MKKPYADSASPAEADQSLPESAVAEQSGSAREPGRQARAARHARNPGANVADQLMVKQREMITGEFEQYYISKGLPIEVELGGPDKTHITLLSPLFCKDSVHRLVKKTNLFSYLRQAGFRKATIGDANEETWAYDLGTL